jgi:hypothetical protein
MSLETEVELRIDGAVQGVAPTPDHVIALDKVTAAYMRPYSSAQLPAIERAGPLGPAWQNLLVGVNRAHLSCSRRLAWRRHE